MKLHPKRKKRMILIAFLLGSLATAVGFTLMALQKNINLFLTPTLIAQNQAPKDKAFRLGGMVKIGSIEKDTQSLRVRFVITDFTNETHVFYEGILPDLFKENKGVVVHGAMNAQGHFIADEVLAKHDENYMPPNIKEKP